MIGSHAGIATHCIPSSRLDSVIATLCDGPHPPDTINRLLEHFSAEYEPSGLQGILPAIAKCFKGCNVEGCVARLEDLRKNGSEAEQEWASSCIESMAKNSPLASKVCAPFFLCIPLFHSLLLLLLLGHRKATGEGCQFDIC